MPLEFVFLADREDAIPIVTDWYHEEWGHLRRGDTVSHTRDRVEEYLNRDRIPFILLATQEDNIVATAQLKFREMAEMFPDKEHWLGGVFVPAGHRDQGHGARIVEQIVKMAPAYGVRTLNLQTEALDGGMYARLGWTPCAQVRYRGLDVLVMERHVSG